MTPAAKLGSLVVLVGAAGAAGFVLHDRLPLDPLAFLDHPLTRACEAGIRETLVAPSTYRRISVSEIREQQLSLDAYWARQREPVSATEKAFTRRQTDHATTWTVDLQWEAANRMGVPLRSTSECSYSNTDGDGRRASEYTILIDGKSVFDRMLGR
jgi:hypothetical protein